MFQTVIGLEIHAQLDISTKLFSGCPIPQTSSLYQKPNSSVWPLDVAVPGFLPRLSQEAVHAAVLSAAATKCNIPMVSRFERKHYFYADLPLGYQVTQQRWPLAREGMLVCHKQQHGKKKKKKTSKDDDDDDTFITRIERIQLEQDTGKTITTTTNNGNGSGDEESLVDFNRAGCALMEVVFYPDLRSASDAATAVETLRNLLRHIGTCNGKMEEGSLRCDLNVSIAPLLEDDLDDDGSSSDDNLLDRTGHRVEVKNLNSIRQVQQAAEYEAIRQAEAVVNGDPTGQETRTFDVKSGKTVVMRTKGGAKDYRFMPEPDLPPLVLDNEVSYVLLRCCQLCLECAQIMNH
jgi:aspartyl-tRNA(Asn)/glutamyl-tRNA(Gln) amidotransferase subunit B